MSEHFNVVGLESRIEKVESGEQMRGERGITCDDDYRDNYEYAAP